MVKILLVVLSFRYSLLCMSWRVHFVYMGLGFLRDTDKFFAENKQRLETSKTSSGRLYYAMERLRN